MYNSIPENIKRCSTYEIFSKELKSYSISLYNWDLKVLPEP